MGFADVSSLNPVANKVPITRPFLSGAFRSSPALDLFGTKLTEL